MEYRQTLGVGIESGSLLQRWERKAGSKIEPQDIRWLKKNSQQKSIKKTSPGSCLPAIPCRIWWSVHSLSIYLSFILLNLQLKRFFFLAGTLPGPDQEVWQSTWHWQVLLGASYGLDEEVCTSELLLDVMSRCDGMVCQSYGLQSGGLHENAVNHKNNEN